MAGQVKPQGKSVKDFGWFTKEEIEKQVEEHYWNGVKDILSDY
jgi:large subunit ribosomal protein L46